jgi:hypothetical protein
MLRQSARIAQRQTSACAIVATSTARHHSQWTYQSCAQIKTNSPWASWCPCVTITASLCSQSHYHAKEGDSSIWDDTCKKLQRQPHSSAKKIRTSQLTAVAAPQQFSHLTNNARNEERSEKEVGFLLVSGLIAKR